MGTQIEFVYVATRALVVPERLGLEQTFTIEANKNEPPMPTIQGRTQTSRRGRRKATTIYGRWYSGEINTPFITSNERLYWREYLESTAEEEIHQMKHVNYLGWDDDVSALQIYRPMNTGGLTRYELGDEYRGSIEWKEVDL